MQRLLLPAAILLVIQIALVVALNSRESGFEPFAPNEPVAQFDQDEVDLITITGEESEVAIKRKDKRWLIAESPDVPANPQQVDTFLEKLANLKRTLAVATSKSAAQRFKVDDDQYGQHLVLSGNGKEMANFYFGTSPGFKQIHMRSKGEDEIITVGFSSHELSSEIEQWIDKTILNLNKEQITGVEVPGYSFIKNDDASWEVEAEGNLPQPAKEQIDTLIEKISSFSVNGFSSETTGNTEQADPGLSFSVTLSEGDTLDWQFAPEGENSFLVTRSDLDFQPRVSSWQVEELTKLLAEHFSAKKVEESADSVQTQ